MIDPENLTDSHHYLKGHVNFCHHFVSVVVVRRRQLSTFQSSPLKPLGQMEPNLAGMFLGWSSTKFVFFVPIGIKTWPPGPIMRSDWLKFEKSSPL